MVFASIYRNIHGTHMFPQCFPVSHVGNIVSSVSFCFQDANYACLTQQGTLTKIRACKHFESFLRARSSEHSSKFCEQFEQRPNFASTFELDGTIRPPYSVNRTTRININPWIIIIIDYNMVIIIW